ncbi:hypothetical protein [Nisaea sp.]|uniref:hypothetical protein n=1 Tax=Nisaea sp. TaxID=2024842 RepID=UPI003B527F45
MSVVLIAALAWAHPARSGDAGPSVFLADTELATGALPELRFARWPVDRWAAVYVRLADASVVRLSARQRGSGDDAEPVQLAHGAERRIWLGGRSGYFVAPRTGVASDREALIVLLAAGRAPDFTGLAPMVGAVAPDSAPSAENFFRRLAGAQWVGEVEIHIVPYRIRARVGETAVHAGRSDKQIRLVFSGLPFDSVLIIADILAAETADPPRPLHIGRPDGDGRVAFGYRTALDMEVFAARLARIIEDLGLKATVAADGSTRRLDVSASRPERN